jgi:hypothetical protein
MIAVRATNISSNVIALYTLCPVREPGICNAVQVSAKLLQAVQDAPFHAMPAEQNSKTPLRVWVQTLSYPPCHPHPIFKRSIRFSVEVDQQ